MTSIKCAHCKGAHTTVADVRECAARAGIGYTRQAVARVNRGFQQALADPAASFAQDFPALSEPRGTGTARFGPAVRPAQTYAQHHHDDYKKAQAARATSAPLATEPHYAGKTIKQRFAEAAACLPVGKDGRTRYALERDGVWKFYQVNKPQTGKWEGWTFVSALGSDTAYRMTSANHQLQILQAIAFNVEKALADYGLQLGHCGLCGRDLTNKESIDRGIGPVCLKKYM